MLSLFLLFSFISVILSISFFNPIFILFNFWFSSFNLSISFFVSKSSIFFSESLSSSRIWVVFICKDLCSFMSCSFSFSKFFNFSSSSWFFIFSLLSFSDKFKFSDFFNFSSNTVFSFCNKKDSFSIWFILFFKFVISFSFLFSSIWSLLNLSFVSSLSSLS